MKLFPPTTKMEDVIRERRADVAEVSALGLNKLNGRIRTATRAAPSGHTDVVVGDAEGDEVTDATHVYTLKRMGGALVWEKRTPDITW